MVKKNEEPQFILNSLSDEQSNVIKFLKKSFNLIVDSVAGSGKTTTCLHIAKELNDLNILLLTYNSRLKEETREKRDYFKLTNLEVHSYHAFCMRYYSKCLVDEDIKNIINSKMAPRNKFKYDIVIIDESQDITFLYYNLICKIINDMNYKKFQFCIIGDRYQSIYQYNGADQRFIINASKLLNFNEHKWKELNLSTSYRLTNQMGNFINSCALDYNRINTVKKSKNKVRYLISNPFNDNKVYDEIKYYLDLGYGVEDIFILAPTIKSKSEKSPIRILSNKLSENGYFLYLPKSDEEKVSNNPEELKGKIMFLSYHQSKGLEKKVVIVMGFDESWFDYFGKYKLFGGNNNVSLDVKNDYMSKCSNELYVALSRAKDCMTIVHNKCKKHLKFLKQNLISDFSQVIGEIGEPEKKTLPFKYKSVTEIIRHLSDDVMENALKFITEKEIKTGNDDLIAIDSLIKQKEGNLENVSDIIGTSIPIYFEYSINQKLDFVDTLNHENNIFMCDMNKIEPKILTIKEKLENKKIKISDVLELSNILNYYKDGFVFKINQVNNYNFVEKESFKKTNKRLKEHIDIKIPFKTEFLISSDSFKNVPELLGVSIGGAIDCINGDNVYEFKHVTKLDKSHKVQIAIYMYLYEMYKIHNFEHAKKTLEDNSDKDDEKSKNITNKYYLLNVYDNKKYKFKAELKDLKKMMEYIIFCKYFSSNDITDDEFYEKCNCIREKYKKINLDD